MKAYEQSVAELPLPRVEPPATGKDPWSPTCYSAEQHQAGERSVFCTSARTQPDGRFRFIWTLAPKKAGPIEHLHSEDNEWIEVVSGRVRVWIDGSPRDLGPGDQIHISPGTPHRFWNPGPEPMVARVSYDGTQMEDLFMPLAKALHDGVSPVRAFARMTIYLVERTPQVPTKRWIIPIGKALIWVLKSLGVRAHSPVYGWDQATESRSSNSSLR